MVNWQKRTPFSTKVQMPMVPVDPETLKRCSKGLSKHIHKATDPVKRNKLRETKEEIDWLIENL